MQATGGGGGGGGGDGGRVDLLICLQPHRTGISYASRVLAILSYPLHLTRLHASSE